MVAGNAFMVSDRFIVDQCALRKVRGGDHNAAGSLTVRSASHIMARRGGLEGRNRLDSHRRLRKQGEELGQFGLHLRNVVAKVLENLLSGGRLVFGIGSEERAKRSEVREALF